MSRTAKVKSARCGGLTTILTWLFMEHPQGTKTRLRGAVRKATERAAQACRRHERGIQVALRGLLVESGAPGNEGYMNK